MIKIIFTKPRTIYNGWEAINRAVFPKIKFHFIEFIQLWSETLQHSERFSTNVSFFLVLSFSAFLVNYPLPLQCQRPKMKWTFYPTLHQNTLKSPANKWTKNKNKQRVRKDFEDNLISSTRGEHNPIFTTSFSLDITWWWFTKRKTFL